MKQLLLLVSIIAVSVTAASARLGENLSAVGQSVPPPVEMKGFKVYHLESGQKAAQ